MFERLKQAGMSAYAKLVDYLPDPIVKEVTLVVLSRDDPYEESYYEVKEYRVEDASIKKITKLFGEVHLTRWSPDCSLESLEKSLCYIQYPPKLEDGQKYVLTYLPISGKLEERLCALETYRKNATKFLEDSGEKGYTYGKRYYSVRSGDNFEIERTSNLLKSSKEKNFVPFRDCPVFKMVAGAIGGNAKAQVIIHKELERRKIGLFLTSGHSLDVGDSCIGRKSPVLTDGTLVKNLVQIRRFILKAMRR